MPRYHKYPTEYYSTLPKIYYLSFKGVPFYVGLTTLPLIKRLCDARKDSKSSNSPKDIFIRERLDKANDLDIHLLEIVDNSDHALFLEEYWIQQLKAWGFELLNKYKLYPPKRLQRRDLDRYIKFGMNAKPYTPRIINVS